MNIGLGIALLFVARPQANDALVPIPRSDDWWKARHGMMVDLAKRGKIDLIFVGDSITHSFAGEPDTHEDSADRGKLAWDYYYSRRHPLNLGMSGDRTQHVLWRLDHGEVDGIAPKAAVVMIGTNNVGDNSSEQIAQGVEAVVEKLHSKLPTTKVLLLAIFPRDAAASDHRKKLAEANRMLAAWSPTHGATFLDIGSVFVDSRGEIPPTMMPDGLHPMAAGYLRWARAIEPTLAWLTGEAPLPELPTSVIPAIDDNPTKAHDYDWLKRHDAVLAAIKQGPTDLVFIGDSITHFWGGRPGAGEGEPSYGLSVWNKFYASRNALDEGFGWDRTEHVLWRIDHGELDGIAPKVAVVMIGTNNLVHSDDTGHTIGDSPAETAQGVRAVLDRIQKKLPKTKILLLGVFPRGEKPGFAVRRAISDVNSRISRFADGDRIVYMDIGPKFLSADGTLSKEIMPDYLHPQQKGYEIWADAIEETLAKMMGDSKDQTGR